MASIPGRIRGIALRGSQELPSTIAERLKDYRALNVADWVMYRRSLAAAADAHGWVVHWYDPKKVLSAASEAMKIHGRRDRRCEGLLIAGRVALTARGVLLQDRCSRLCTQESKMQSLRSAEKLDLPIPVPPDRWA